MIGGESNIYVVVAPGGGLAGVHLDQESPARTQAALIGGVVGLIPVVADFRRLPVTERPEPTGDAATWSASLAEQVATHAKARAKLPHGQTGAERRQVPQPLAAGHAADMRRCCDSLHGRVHLPGCTAGGDRL